MKKIISLIAAAAIAVSCIPVFAANADNMQEVLLSVKQRVDIPEEYTEFESSTTHSDYNTQYHFEWHTEDYEKSMYVSCYDDGMITSYGSYDGYREREPHISKMSADEAKQIAEDFVQTINPNYPYEVVVQDNDNASIYNTHRYFAIGIYANGVYIENESGSVTVDTEKGSVTDFNIWYEPDTKEYFTDLEQFIPAGDAKQAYIAAFPMELVYRSYYDDDNKEIFYPVYTTTDGYNEYINGVTGEKEAVDFYRNAMRAYETADMGEEEMSTASKANLTPQELEEIEKINNLIPKETIEKQLRANKVLNLPQKTQTENIYLTKNWRGDTYRYYVTMSVGDDFINADIDALTGEIYSYYRSYPDAENRESKNDAALKALAGDKASEFMYNVERNYYERYINGIKVEGNNAYLGFADGVLTEYNISYSNAEFPSIDAIMSAEDAAWALLEQTDYKAVCVAGYNGDGEACLYPVYSLNALSINPFTGKAVDWQNNELTGVENAPLTYSDISGHYAEKYITALAEYGIGFEGGLFKPDEKITQLDLLTLLNAIYGGGDVIVFLDSKVQAENTYTHSLSHNIIAEDERDDNSVITRETASIYLIRAIGAEEYASYNDIYVTPFDDVTENKGYIALLSAMGVVNGDGGHFNPKREITRAEAAVMLYNYLTR